MIGHSSGLLICDNCGRGSDVRSFKKHGQDFCRQCELNLAYEKIGELREALRNHCLGSLTNGQIGRVCVLCKGMWGEGQPEEHKLNCLAELPN